MRKADVGRLGLDFGVGIPEKRTAGHAEFLGTPGAVFEVKRASPSRGDIAPDLDPVALAAAYAEAGAQAVSVLTEGNFFKGSLKDLVAVADLMESRRRRGLPACAVLRKDFLLFEDEIDVAFRSGADAVLLIARILDDERLVGMARRAASFGMQAFVEVREPDDLRKLDLATRALGDDAARTIVAGVNSRDLATFRIDPLVPAALRGRLPAKAVFESGVRSPADARFARDLGFTGILVGEAVAKEPALAAEVARAFGEEPRAARGRFWRELAVRRAAKAGAPLVKVCGIARTKDGLFAAESGADLLGFVFARSPRRADPELVREFARAQRRIQEFSNERQPLLVGVIAETESPEARAAIALARDGHLDALQCHGFRPGEELDDVARYCAVRVGSASDLAEAEALLKGGEPRLLLDAKVEGIAGGTGTRVPEEALREASGRASLWIAGGVTPENAAEIREKFRPELIDVSSGVEKEPGVKDHGKIRALFEALGK
ncbi:MAG: bifunctional indole-3-glycerol phosphate synthase/phosphoribosylanthranilate isomerase [Fibrobacterales bacterium]|nr:bifunctional indole-3-glycerol phosphate synthase/phosphoribosylanthranilate isomerase [Fibrobacterales bacterium]